MTTCLGPAFVNMRAANAKRSKVKPEAGLPVCWTEAVGSLAEINGWDFFKGVLAWKGFHPVFYCSGAAQKAFCRKRLWGFPPV